MSAEGVEKQVLARKMCLACSREYQGDISTCPEDGTDLIALDRPDPLIGHVLADKYEILELAGKGGMGSVYRARHQMMDRLVALKMLHAELAQDESSRKRFQQEAKAASHLSHPHLITLFDVGITATNQPYIVMEYLEGTPLIDIIKLDGPMDPKRAVKIFSQIADGLHHAHTQGILHRDLKPSNVLLINHQGDFDFVKILDFGLAKLMPWSGKESQHLTKTGEVFGSPIYMSPEQCMGKPLDRTSDIYSFGITLFEALIGKPPFRGKNSIETATQHMQAAPPRFADFRPDLFIPAGLEAVVLKCLQKQPEDRFQDMAGLRDALQAGLTDTRVEIPESLLISTRAIPAITSSQTSSITGTNPIKTEGGRKPITDLRSRAAVEPPKRNQGLMVGIVGGLIVAGGAVIALLPTSTNITGTVYYYDAAPGGKVEISEQGGKLRTLPIDKFVPDWNQGIAKSALGDVVTASFSTSLFGDKTSGPLTAVKSDGAPNEAIHLGLEQVSNFIVEFVDSVKVQAEKRVTDPALLGKFETMIPTPYRTSTGLLGRLRPGLQIEVENKDSDYPETRFFKVAFADKSAVVIMVDGAAFTDSTSEHPFWKFTVELNGSEAKIKDIERIEEAQWLNQ